MNKRTLIMLIIGGVLLFPLQVPATVCFNVTGGPRDVVVVLEVQMVGGFANLVGEVIGICGPGNNAPLNGSAYIGSDGKVHFGMNYHNGMGSECPPMYVHAILEPPSFRNGSGFLWLLDGRTAQLIFSTIACPPVPQ